MWHPMKRVGVQVLKVLELYAGGGGSCYVDCENADVKIKGCWAVDCEPSMTATLISNFPDLRVVIYLTTSLLYDLGIHDCSSLMLIPDHVMPWSCQVMLHSALWGPR